MNKQPTKLENIFNGEIVFCENVEDIKIVEGLNFIRVFTEENINRFFLVNRAAYKILNK